MRFWDWPAIVGVAAALCLLAGTISAADYVKPPADQNITPCGSNPGMDLAAYVVAYTSMPPIRLGQGRTVPDDSIPHIPAAWLVPKEFMIYNAPATFRPVVGTAHSFRLPILDREQWDYGNVIRNGVIVISPCRVRDPSGRWWLVLRDNTINYYLLDEFEPIESSNPRY